MTQAERDAWAAFRTSAMRMAERVAASPHGDCEKSYADAVIKADKKIGRARKAGLR